MPNFIVTCSNNKDNFDIQVVDLNKEKDKKELEKEASLPILPHTGKLRFFFFFRYPNKNFPKGKE